MQLFNKILIKGYDLISHESFEKEYEIGHYKDIRQLVDDIKSLYLGYWENCTIEIFGNFGGEDYMIIHAPKGTYILFDEYLADSEILDKCTNWDKIVEEVEDSLNIDNLLAFEWDENTLIVNIDDLYPNDEFISEEAALDLKQLIKEKLSNIDSISYNIKLEYDDVYEEAKFRVTINPYCANKIRF